MVRDRHAELRILKEYNPCLPAGGVHRHIDMFPSPRLLSPFPNASTSKPAPINSLYMSSITDHSYCPPGHMFECCSWVVVQTVDDCIFDQFCQFFSHLVHDVIYV